MLIKYEFINGDISEVEVSDEIGAMIIESRKAEHALDEKERYHNYSLDAIDYEGDGYGFWEDYDLDERKANASKIRTILREGLSKLTETQRRRISLFIQGKTVREIAEIEKVDVRAVHDSISQVRKKFEKVIKKHSTDDGFFCV